MNYLVYISTAVKLMTDQDLTDILKISRRNNLNDDITGMLLYGEGTFIQTLEGSKEAIEQMLETIKKDKRHKGLMLVLTGENTERTFPDWSMGFKAMDAKSVKKLNGYFNPSEKNLLHIENNSKALIMLKSFAETNRLIL